jgi:hypothetical protein
MRREDARGWSRVAETPVVSFRAESLHCVNKALRLRGMEEREATRAT